MKKNGGRLALKTITPRKPRGRSAAVIPRAPQSQAAGNDPAAMARGPGLTVRLHHLFFQGFDLRPDAFHFCKLVVIVRFRRAALSNIVFIAGKYGLLQRKDFFQLVQCFVHATFSHLPVILFQCSSFFSHFRGIFPRYTRQFSLPGQPRNRASVPGMAASSRSMS